MSDRAPTLPESLRQAVVSDIEPVRPLASPWVRVLWAVPLAAVLSLTALLYFGLRPDAEAIGSLLSWVPTILEATLGLAILGIALQEAVPGRRLPREVIFGVSLGALALHLSVNTLIWLRDPMGYEEFFSSWWMCFRYEFLLGIPFLAIIAFMAARALPVRPPVIGMLAGAGGGVVADASWRLVCPISVPSHFLTAHFGGILVLGFAGYMVGGWVERRRAARATGFLETNSAAGAKKRS